MIPPIASRFVAGESATGALNHTRDLNEDGLGAIVNLLGEHYHKRPPADDDADIYVNLVERIAAADLDACVSVKPSQIGIDVEPSVFIDNLRRIADTASVCDVFLWVDMEDHTTTDATLDAVGSIARAHDGGVGVCVQANLKRTRDDLRRLADFPVKVRLVKGAYDEPASVAYTDKADVNEQYREHLALMFREFDSGVAVGSHDPEMVSLAADLHEEYGTDFEYQMLMGVREDAQRELVQTYDMWQYVPYGSKWASYFYRRAMERKENLVFAARAVLGH
jgi:proline dehydrogenase